MAKNFTNMSDDELFSQLKLGKKEARYAFDEIYNRYSKQIYTYCKKMLKTSELAEDIFQETFVKFYEHIPKVKELVNLKGFLFKIARNLCLNEINRNTIDTVEINEEIIEWKDESFNDIDKLEVNELIHKTIDLLPDIYKEVLILKEFMDLQYNEIADNLDLSMNVVRMRLFRARKYLRELLNPFLEELSINEKK